MPASVCGAASASSMAPSPKPSPGVRYASCRRLLGAATAFVNANPPRTTIGQKRAETRRLEFDYLRQRTSPELDPNRPSLNKYFG